MLWFSRFLIFALGVVAWIVSYVLATWGLGPNTPAWLIPGIVAFGSLYLFVGVWSLGSEWEAHHKNEVENLARYADELADRIWNLITNPPVVYNPTRPSPEGELPKTLERQAKELIDHYKARFAKRVRRIAAASRRYRVYVPPDLSDEDSKLTDIHQLESIVFNLDWVATKLRELH